MHRAAPIEGELIKGSVTSLLVDDKELIFDVGKAVLERLDGLQELSGSRQGD